MFMIRNVGKLIFGSGSSQETLFELPQGQLYLVRPLSPKGYSELIFKDAAITIRRTAQEFHYQLVVQRVYEEGEAELLAEEEGEDAEIDALASERDEKTFLLDEALQLRIEVREGTEKVIAWKDLSGDTGDVYEFVCDVSISKSNVAQFETIARQSQYERKYRKPHSTASVDDLKQFEFHHKEPIPPASPLHGPTRAIESVGPILHQQTDLVEPVAADEMRPPTANSSAKRSAASEAKEEEPSPQTMQTTQTTLSIPKPLTAPKAVDTYGQEAAELHFYDINSAAFVLQDESVTATVTETGAWQYWLQVDGQEKAWLGLPVIADMNPVFNFEFLSFIFNQFAEDGCVYSWLLRFKDQPTLERFQNALLQCMWEQMNEIKWTKIKEKERDYITEAFADLAMADVAEEDEEQEEEKAEERAKEEEEEYDDDEEGREEEGGDDDDDDDDDDGDDDDDDDNEQKDSQVNSQLAVGYKHDRSFVVRGSKIGVFKHTPNNQLQFSTTISKVETPKGKLFSPKKVMLHNEDRDMVLQHNTDPSKLYRMDLEYGKVVDEWNVHDDIPVVTFAPESKFAQMTHEPTFLGISHNALFRVDPRLSGTKLVDSQLKQYATKNDFSAAGTTEKGHIAVASNKGDIRLFDRLGINAKTHIPALGEPIIGLDTSADGRWVLATCRTYLLLVDTLQKSGKNEGKLGFERSFPAQDKPTPRRLALTPEHVAQFAHETGKGVDFKPAKFNAGMDAGVEETSIITATGPYVIEWNMKKLLRGAKAPYLIKRYGQDVKADDFKFGSDKNVIVALPNEVNMVGKQSLKKPTRQSIAGEFLRNAGRKSSGRIGGSMSGRYKLGKDDVVESPY